MTTEDKAEWQSLLRPKLRKWKWKSPRSVQLFAIPWTIQSKEFSRPETGVGNLSFSRGSSQPRDRTQVSEVTQNKVFHLIFLFKKTLEKFSTNYLLKYFLMAFLFVFFWDSYDSNVGVLNIVPVVSEVVLISFNPSRVFFYLISCIIHYWLTLFYFF